MLFHACGDLDYYRTLDSDGWYCISCNEKIIVMATIFFIITVTKMPVTILNHTNSNINSNSKPRVCLTVVDKKGDKDKLQYS